MPQRGKTPNIPKRAGRTPRSGTRSRENNGSPAPFKTPKNPKTKRSTRVTKTPGWFSPTEDTFKLPVSPSPSRRVTRRSTVFNIPEYSSFIPIELSPRRTRGSSVYQKNGKVPPATIPAASRRSSMAVKPKQQVSTRRSSVYRKGTKDEPIQSKLVKPSNRPPRVSGPSKFSPIRTRRQSMLPRKTDLGPLKEGLPNKIKASGKNILPSKFEAVQRATKSSAAKAKVKSKSPVVASKVLSTTSLKSHAIKRTTESKVFVNDLVSLSPMRHMNSPNVQLLKASSDIVLSPRGARTKTASRSATATDLTVKNVVSSSVQLNNSTTPEPKSTTKLPIPKGSAKSVTRKCQALSSPSCKSVQPACFDGAHISSGTEEVTMVSAVPTSSGTERKRSAEKAPSSGVKKAKMDKSVYATPVLESPRSLLRKKVTSQIALSPATPEFRTPAGGNSKKPAYRKGTPMRPGIQNALQMKKASSTPSLNVGTAGIKPSATRKTRRGKKQESVLLEKMDVFQIDGGDAINSAVIKDMNCLDVVDAASNKEPLALNLSKTVEKKPPSQNTKCTIL